MNIIKTLGKYTFYNQLEFLKELTPKNYVFEYDGFYNPFLRDASDFSLPTKLYDVDTPFRKMVKRSYEAYDSNLGILLMGNKGQGKSVTAKLLCQELGLPVITVTDRIPVEVDFIQFFKGIDQDFILFIDEFEKLFDTADSSDDIKYHSQEKFLSFMDGVSNNKNKIIFIFTSNEHVNEYLINRPSRIKFVREYNELPEELFHQIADDLLVNKEYKNDLEENLSFLNLNIDLLISIINDVNLFDQPFSTFADIYNYKFEQYRYDVYVIDKETGLEKWYSTVSQDRRPKISSRYMCSFKVNNLISFKKEEIIFESNLWDDEKDETKNVIIKLVPMKGNTIITSKANVV